VQPPSGTVTFLFTDVEDSTRRWESTPAHMTSAMQAHDIILRSAIERHGGYVFATGGDGFCAAFSSAVDAVMAAVESQQELEGDGIIPFVVRMGLHTGEAIERDDNYYGTEVNRAARLMALAHGGQGDCPRCQRHRPRSAPGPVSAGRRSSVQGVMRTADSNPRGRSPSGA
jgi:class 3 adenylate cyclase